MECDVCVLFQGTKSWQSEAAAIAAQSLNPSIPDTQVTVRTQADKTAEKVGSMCWNFVCAVGVCGGFVYGSFMVVFFCDGFL